jgi:hypothetical protein
MKLRDRRWYRLPDGTRVQARLGKSPPRIWGLISADGRTSLYGFSEEHGMIQWVPAQGGYRIAHCDLTVDDLQPASSSPWLQEANDE